MIFFSIFLSISVILFCYFLVSKRDGTFINVLTPSLIIFIPANYLLELIHIYFFGFDGTPYAYLYTYTSYALYFLFLTFAYLYIKTGIIKLPFRLSTNFSSIYPHIILLLGFILYVPILLEFKDSLTNPREIYSLTRTGYGLFFYLSTTLTYLAFILYLFKGKTIFPLLLCGFLIALHGSKGQMITLLFILMLYRVYILEKRVSLLKTFGYVALIISFLFTLFSLTFKNVQTDNFLLTISEYSDYTRNSIKIIDEADSANLGKLTLSDFFYSKLPRIFFPNKPKDFGSFYLAKKHFPDRFYADTGTPDFGLIGMPYADFGPFAILFLSISGLFTGILLKIFRERLRYIKGISDFIMFIFFAGINLIPLGAGYMVIEHFFLAVIFNIVLFFKFSDLKLLIKTLR